MGPPDLDFGALFEASPNAYMVLDRELRYVAANRAYLRLTGSRFEDLRGRRIFEVFPDDPSNPDNENTRLLRASLERVLETGEPDHLALIPYRVAREAGAEPEARFWSATHTPLRDAEGRVAFVQQHTVDVTEVERLKAAASNNGPDQRPGEAAGLIDRARAVQEANRSLDAQLSRLRSLFDQAPGFVAVLSGPKHVFELVNQAYLDIIGRGREVIGRDIRDALPEVESQGFVELLDRVYTSGEPYVGRAVKVALRRGQQDELDELYLDFIYQPMLDEALGLRVIFVQGTSPSANTSRTNATRARPNERSCSRPKKSRASGRRTPIDSRTNSSRPSATSSVLR